MVITNEGKMVKLKDDKHGKLILISQPIPDMKVFIRFKITGLTTNFQTLLGVASKQRVVQNNFKFDSSHEYMQNRTIIMEPI